MSELDNDSFVTLGELVDEPVAQTGPSGDFIYIDISSIDRETKKITETKHLAYTQAPSRAKQVLKAGDVLVSMTRPNLNAVALVPQELAGAIGSTGFHVLRSSWLHPKYLLALVQTHSFIDAMSSVVQGALYPAVRPRDVAAYRFKYETPGQQIRIVEKLEELLTDLDSGVAELKMAQSKLAQYRQSLLKAAVEGELTAQWRKKKLVTESGEKLLGSILMDRRASWEAKQLAKFSEQGKLPSKEWHKKYPEPVKPDITNLPQLPEGWVWATLSQVGWLDRGRSKHRPRNAPHLYGGSYPFVQTGDIRHADTFISHVDTSYSEAGLAQSRLWPRGTMCITIAANIGKTAILSIEACFPDSVVGFIPVSDKVSVRYVEYFMRSIQERLENSAPATAQKNINLETLAKVAIPIPPLYEQNHIVSVLDRAFTAAKENERTIAFSMKQSLAQRQNILRTAFSGKLVPRDPNDEPVGDVLERIKAKQVEKKSEKKTRNIKKSAPMNKPLAESLREFIKGNSESDFSFETLRRFSSSDYEVVKNALFQLLTEENPIIEQIFDCVSGSIVFRKVKS